MNNTKFLINFILKVSFHLFSWINYSKVFYSDLFLFLSLEQQFGALLEEIDMSLIKLPEINIKSEKTSPE